MEMCHELELAATFLGRGNQQISDLGRIRALSNLEIIDMPSDEAAE